MKHTIELQKEAIKNTKKDLSHFTKIESAEEAEACNDLSKYLSELESELQQLEGRGWISVEERLPEGFNNAVLAISSGGYMYVAGYSEYAVGWYLKANDDPNFPKDDITHWQPLPSAPELTPNK